MSAKTAKPEQDYVIDQKVVKQQEELSIQIQNLNDKFANIFIYKRIVLGQQRETNKTAQGHFTSKILKDVNNDPKFKEKKVFYLTSNNFMKMNKETAFKILEKDQAKVLNEKKKLDQQINQLLQKLSKMKPYSELLDLDVQDLLIEYIKENEDMDDD